MSLVRTCLMKSSNDMLGRARDHTLLISCDLCLGSLSGSFCVSDLSASWNAGPISYFAANSCHSGTLSSLRMISSCLLLAYACMLYLFRLRALGAVLMLAWWGPVGGFWYCFPWRKGAGILQGAR